MLSRNIIADICKEVYNRQKARKEGAAMGMEYELKYRTQAQTLLALRQRFDGQGVLYTMGSTYFDTPSGALSERRFTLRRRMENGKSVCTLKVPAGKQGRGEWETDCPDIMQAIPQLVALGAPAEIVSLTGEGLREVCGAEFTRLAVPVTYEGTELELALDQGVLTGGGGSCPFWEVEVELKAGEREITDRYAAALAGAYDLEAESRSKFQRALALSKGERI